MIRFVVFAVLTTTLGLSGCGIGDGACVGEGGGFETACKMVSRDHCDGLEEDQINGQTWTFEGGQCEDLGYDNFCYTNGNEYYSSCLSFCDAC